MVIPILETLGIVALSVAAFFLGKWISKLNKQYWIFGLVPPFILLLLVSLPRWISRFEQIFPFSWIMIGRIEFVLIAVSATTLLSTLSFKIDEDRQRRLIQLLIYVVAGYFILPFLFPALLFRYHSDLQSNMESEGIIFQSNTYNCGPAAATTALWSLGIKAKEGIIAIHAKTSPMIGTQPDLLCRAINQLYQEAGVSCKPINSENINELKDNLPYIAVVKLGFMVDHWVTVLEIDETTVKIADPLHGVIIMTNQEFNELWRKSGLAVIKS